MSSVRNSADTATGATLTVSNEVAALRLENISKIFNSYGSNATRFAAVDGINLDISSGQMITLLGPSGCGKTTTLRIIAGFEQPTEGRVWLEGRDITAQSANKRDMAMVFQSYALFPHLSVYENVAYGLKVRKTNAAELKRRVGQALSLTELVGLENRQPNQLSGGQQQRVALARAIVVEPKVLLFDEPLSNLDAKLREQMRGELRRIQQELGLTGVYVTHDQAEAMTISDLVVVMNKGKIEQAASPLQIYRQPSSRFVAEFIGKASFLIGNVVETRQEVMLIESQGQTWQIRHFPRPLAQGEKVTLVVRPEGVKLAPAGKLALPARVKTITYLGSYIEYELLLSDNTSLTGMVTVIGQDWLPAMGEEVSVTLVESALAVLEGVSEK